MSAPDTRPAWMAAVEAEMSRDSFREADLSLLQALLREPNPAGEVPLVPTAVNEPVQPWYAPGPGNVPRGQLDPVFTPTDDQRDALALAFSGVDTAAEIARGYHAMMARRREAEAEEVFVPITFPAPSSVPQLQSQVIGAGQPVAEWTPATPPPMAVDPVAAGWVAALLRNSQAPRGLRDQVAIVKEILIAQLENTAPVSVQAMAAQAGHNCEADCPTCGQKTALDTSNERCPICSKKMRIRHNRMTKKPFLGCTGYPNCTGTIDVGRLIQTRATTRRQQQTTGGHELLRHIDL